LFCIISMRISVRISLVFSSVMIDDIAVSPLNYEL
jgi:hypothetical protein